MFFLQEKGQSPSLGNAVLATPIRLLSCPHAANARVYGALCAARRDPYRRESASFVERLKTKLPTSLRKTRFVGSCIIS